VFELHTFTFLAICCQKWPYLKLSPSSSVLFKSVE
jgi:hypothetical protein